MNRIAACGVAFHCATPQVADLRGKAFIYLREASPPVRQLSPQLADFR
jgi:hypothetical protein